MFFACLEFIYNGKKSNVIQCKCSNCEYKKQPTTTTDTVDYLPEYFPPFPHSFN